MKLRYCLEKSFRRLEKIKSINFILVMVPKAAKDLDDSWLLGEDTAFERRRQEPRL